MLSSLARASLDGAIVVAVVFVLTRAVPHLSPAARAMLWWCAAAKFILALGWIAPLEVPVLPALAPQPAASIAQRNDPIRLESEQRLSAGVALDARAATDSTPVWWTAMLAFWIAGIGFSSALALRNWVATRRAIRNSEPPSAAIEAMARELAARLRMPRIPDVRISADVETPLVTRLRRPIVLLPRQRFAALPAGEQRMALCHELAHVKRADLWLGCAPALAERVFFFHPLVRFAAREYAFWREAACDLAVLKCLDAAPQEYGRLLLSLGVSRPPDGFAAAGASWSFVNLKRRIAMLRHPSARSIGSRLATAAAAAVSFATLAPVHLSARPPAEAAHVRTGAPVAAVPEEQRERDASFVYFVDDNHTTTSGSTGDVERARQHRRGRNEPLLWFRHGNREYVVRDPSTLAAVSAIWEPVNALGEEQGRVGAEQGRIGARQGEIGAKQGGIGAEQGHIGARQGELGMRQGRLAAREASRFGRSEAQQREIDGERRAIDREMRDLDEDMRLLDAKMRELDKPMQELSDQMNVLSKEMNALSVQMEQASKRAEEQMLALFERVVKNGLAEAVK